MAIVEYADSSTSTSGLTPSEVLRWATPYVGAVFQLTLLCVGRQSSTGGRACWKQTLLVSNDNGTVTMSTDTPVKVGNLGALSWAMIASIDNDEVVVTVAGALGQDVDWVCSLAGIQVGPF